MANLRRTITGDPHGEEREEISAIYAERDRRNQASEEGTR